MKGMKSEKSVRKQMKKFLHRIEKDQGYTFKVLEEQTKKTIIKLYCDEYKLNYDRVCSVLVYFKIDAESNEEIPVLLLNFIKDIGITTDKKMSAVISDIKKVSPELADFYSSEYKDSISMWTNYLHRDEKTALRKARVTASINKKFYNYLVKRNYLVDVRKPDNWHPHKREAYYKKLEARKRGTDD